MSAVIASARGVVKTFGDRGLLRRSAPTRALDGVDIDIYEGEVVALIGESGSGKTTLGKVLLRLETLDEGRVEFDGVDVFSLGRSELRRRRRSFQMVFQNQAANLHPKMTVRQMLDESLRLHRSDLDAAARRDWIAQLLEKVGLGERAEQRPASLSGGERRRAGLARILATRPMLIVADEPTSGLDAAIKLQIIELLKSLKHDRLTYLLISHDLGLVRRIADRVLVMLQGRIIEEVPAALLGGASFHHPYTAKLVRAAELLEERRRPPRERRGELRPEQRRVKAARSMNPHGGCVHAADCQLTARLGMLEECLGRRPAMVEHGPSHRIACLAQRTSEEE